MVLQNLFRVSACNSIMITTDSDDTRLVMYGYSADVKFDTPSGYTGYNLECNPNNAYILLTEDDYDSFLSIEDSATNVDGDLPCKGVTFTCLETESCSIEYVKRENQLTLDEFQPYFNCHGPIYFEQLFDIECIGTCPISPTSSPTTPSPNVDPGIATTAIPTTKIPTKSPSTANPTESPTSSPSAAPTNHPISSQDFDHYIMITFVLEKLRPEDKGRIAINPQTEIDYFERVLDKAYFIQNLLLYENYLIHVINVDGIIIENIDINTGREWDNSNLEKLRFETKIECNLNAEDISCDSIKKHSHPDDTNNFDENVQATMRNYTGNDNLLFYVEDADNLEISCKNCAENTSPDYVLYVLVAFLSILIIISILALLFNYGKFPKLPGFNYVDNASWTALIIFGLQCWDFYSDIILSIEILNNEQLFDELFMFIAGFGSLTFTVIPYITNLIIASRIKNVIKHNPAAKGWFNYFTPVFVGLVVVCGGCHTALTVVASNIFGLRLLSCGLTRYELKRLNRIRIIGTVMIENVPQLICQALYTVALDYEATQAVWFAFIASSFSIIAVTLSYLIERDQSDANVAEYYISLEKTPITAVLTEDEKRKMRYNKGKTHALGESIAEVFGIASKNIEIGQSMTTKYGIIMHVVHYVYKDDLEAMEEELMSEDIYGKSNTSVTPKYYVSQVFAALTFDINKVFRNHFDLSQDFQVLFHHRISAKKASIRSPTLDPINSNSFAIPTVPYLNKRESVLKTVMDHLTLNNSNDGEKDKDINVQKSQASSELITAIKKYCMVHDLSDKDEQAQSIMQLFKSMNAMYESADIDDNGEIEIDEDEDDVYMTNDDGLSKLRAIELASIRSNSTL